MLWIHLGRCLDIEIGSIIYGTPLSYNIALTHTHTCYDINLSVEPLNAK